MTTAGKRNYIGKMECPKCHCMVRTWVHVEACLGKRVNLKAKEYGVMTTAHGSPFVLDVTDREYPPNPKRYALMEALKEARSWSLRADTIAGSSKVISLTTGTTLAYY